MNLADVLDDVAAAIAGIDGLRVIPYTAQRISPPVAWLEWPESITYDATHGRGADRLVLPLRVAAGAVDARSSRDLLAAYCDGSGGRSVKSAVEDHEPTAYDTARVTGVEFGVIPVAGVEFLTASFSIDIVGTGGN